MLSPLIILSAGQLCDRISPKRLLIRTVLFVYPLFISGLMLILFFFPDPDFPILILLGIYYSIPLWPLVQISLRSFLSSSVPDEKKGYAFAYIFSGQGLGLVIGSLLGGGLKDMYVLFGFEGYREVFFTSFISFLCAVFFGYRFKKIRTIPITNERGVLG